MAVGGVLPEEARPIEGVVDTGIVVLAHFDNPARAEAARFFLSVLRWERRCLIPVTAMIGAYHVMTRYLGVDEEAARRALTLSLETRSPAFYEDVDIETAMNALRLAATLGVESWDGYLLQLALMFDAPIIYSIDKTLAKRARALGIKVINPIPEGVFQAYQEWLAKQLRR